MSNKINDILIERAQEKKVPDLEKKIKRNELEEIWRELNSGIQYVELDYKTIYQL